MPLTLYKRKNKIYHLRGSHHGVTVDRSTRTRELGEARQVKESVEREIFETVVLKKPPERTFAEAAVGYMKSGGERAPLSPILDVVLERPDRTKAPFSDWLLRDIDQGAIDAIAHILHGANAPSTRVRKVITPIAAVLNWAAEQPSWRYSAFRIRRPEQPRGRIDWRRPAEIEWWLENAGHLKGLLTAYVGTGARATELIGLQWKNVTPGGQRMVLWDDETKASKARYIDLQGRVRSALPNRPEDSRGPVFTNQAGKAWSSRHSINNALDRISEAEALRRVDLATRAELDGLRSRRRSWKASPDEQKAASAAYAKGIAEAIQRHDVPTIHLHVFRHTWATWAYAVTRDLTFLMDQGGWASEKLALRYIHGGSDDIKAEVLAHGWTIRA